MSERIFETAPDSLLYALKEEFGVLFCDSLFERQPDLDTDFEEGEEQTGAVYKKGIDVHLMRIPESGSEEKAIPYLLLQPGELKDDDEGSTMPVRIVIALYSHNASDGGLAVLSVITRIRELLLKKGIIGKRFVCIKPLQSAVYPDATDPYYFGEMIANFTIPVIEREVNW